MTRFIAALCLMVLIFGAPHEGYAAEKAVGVSCSGDQNAADWDTVVQCSSGTFIRANPFVANGLAIGTTSLTSGTVLDMGQNTTSMLLPVGTTGQQPSCVTALKGAIRYNSTNSTPEFCDGSSWDTVPGAASSCGSVTGLTFTNLSSQPISTLVISSTATVTFTGCSGLYYPVGVTGAPDAQISVNGGPWITSGAITSGQTAQVRMTTSASGSTTLTATVTVNNTSTNWTTTTAVQGLKAFVTSYVYTGNFGGLSGADAICQYEAALAGYRGVYKALLSDNSTSAISRLTLTYPIVNAADGSLISNSTIWAQALNTGFKYPSGSGSCCAWTGTNEDGSIGSSTCSNWTTTSGTGIYGYISNTGSNVINNGSPNCTNSNLNLACIQQ